MHCNSNICKYRLTFKGRTLYIKGSLHSLLAECLMYQTPYMHEVFQLARCLLEQETQTNHLWVPRKGLAFIRSNDVIYGSPGFDFIHVRT